LTTPSIDPATTANTDPAEAGDGRGRRRVDRRALGEVMRRPTSLLLLVLAVVMAVGFSLLGQWQLARAFENGAVVETESEDPLPLETEVVPQAQTPSDAIGQLFTTSGSWVPEDFSVLDGRLNDGERGSWVVGHFLTTGGDSLAVGMGWTSDPAMARSTAAALERDASALPATIEGRYQQSDQPVVDEKESADNAPSELAVPALVNEWTGAGPVYAGYLTLHDAPAGLTTIFSPAPEREVQLNFLNLFYTIEWALFALIALYIWYRHMRDIVEKEQDEAAVVGAGDAADPQ
jgi:cytochrome oxidase assembly protein ShyY1